jgi:hypothetical protein
MNVADARVSNWWSGLPRSAWYVYQRDGVDRTCATTATEFMLRLQHAIGAIGPGETAPHPWMPDDTQRLAEALAVVPVPFAQLGMFDAPVWTEPMLRAAIWYVNHRGEIPLEQIGSIRLRVPNGQAPLLPRYREMPPRTAPGDSIACWDGLPVAELSRVIPGASRSNVAALVALAAIPVVLGITWVYADWHARARHRD